MNFQSSRTYSNIQSAYENQLEKSTKYSMFSTTARNEVLIKIDFLFDTISRNERFVADKLHNLYKGETNSRQNLEEARDDELSDSNTYREYSRIALEEGYNDIASLFSGIANIKLNHNYALQSVISDIDNNEMFCKQGQHLWICLGCGNILAGECAPNVCPICGYPQGYYELYS